MAIIVDIIALVYILYITYDEYTGKPLGLRSPKAKMRLILLDLFFIVFDSANLSLAFDALSDVRWSCRDDVGVGGTNSSSGPLCVRQRALSSVLLVALVAWITTFSISVLRYVCLSLHPESPDTCFCSQPKQSSRACHPELAQPSLWFLIGYNLFLCTFSTLL
jgi:hypothetical protein